MSLSRVSTEKINLLASLFNQINPVELATPTNYTDVKTTALERKKFENPIFRYDSDRLTEAFNCCREALRTIKDILTILLKLAPEHYSTIYLVLRHRYHEIACIKNFIINILREDDSLSRESLFYLYSFPDELSLKLAEQTAETSAKAVFGGTFSPSFSKNQRNFLRSKNFNANEIASVFETALNRLGISAWKVEASPRFTSIDVRDFDSSGGRVIGIPASRTVNGIKLFELINHELNCHLRSSENSRALFEELLKEEPSFLPLVPILSKSMCEEFYEGVAKLADAKFSGISGVPKPDAVLASKNIFENRWNFKETHEFIFELFKKRHPRPESLDSNFMNSWQVTYRLFRGATHPEAHSGYVFLKDAGYFCGFRKVLNDVSTFEAIYGIVHRYPPSEAVKEIIKYFDIETEQPLSKFLDYSSLSYAELDDLSEVISASKPAFKELNLADFATSLFPDFPKD